MMMDNDTIREWRDHWESYVDLSGDADCASPDSADSPGARMLNSVRDAVFELVDNADEIPDDVSDWDYSGGVHEIADNAPDIRTHTRWREFVDLAAYNEDTTEFGDDCADLTQTAGIALYMIAERLAWAMLNDLHERVAESETEEVPA